jgi:hypothetical protein
VKNADFETPELDGMQKLKIVEGIRINHPRFNRAIKLIEECHGYSHISAEPHCMLITAPSGSGKSTVFNNYVEKNDKVIFGETRTKRVILWDEVSSPTRIPILLESLLDRLGDPFPTKGTVGNKNHRLVNLINDCKVELIMLDEFQHFVNTENKRINYEVADWFKSLVNKTKVPVILFGLDESKLVLDSNPQLKGRFKIHYRLHPFNFNTEANEEEFRRLLDEISKQMPFKDQPTFAEKQMADKLMFASDGLLRPLMSLIRRAAINAIEKDKPYIDEEDFADAFEVFDYNGKEVNPFMIADFEL